MGILSYLELFLPQYDLRLPVRRFVARQFGEGYFLNWNKSSCKA